MVDIPPIAYITGAAVLCVLLTCCCCGVVCSILKYCINKKERTRLEKRENQEAAARDMRRKRRRTIEQEAELDNRAIYQQPIAMQTGQFRFQQNVGGGIPWEQYPISEYPPRYEEVATALPYDDDLEIIKI